MLGAITNIDGKEINRSLKSIKAELQKRQRLFAEADVNHIDKYAHFLIDDMIWVIRDVAHQQQTALFDNLYLHLLKQIFYMMQMFFQCLFLTQ